MGISGAQKRKKKKGERRARRGNGAVEARTDAVWTGLVLHHKDVFAAHVLSN